MKERGLGPVPEHEVRNGAKYMTGTTALTATVHLSIPQTKAEVGYRGGVFEV